MREGVKLRSRREIPAVNKVLDALGEYDLATANKLPRPMIVDLIRRKLSEIRSDSEIPEFESIVDHIRRSLELVRTIRLQPLINGTGIVIHTNFGRAPLSPEAIRALTEIGSGYSNLEYDLATGERGHRGAYIEKALPLVCGAEAATVVNNCAAALILIVHHFTAGGRARPEPARRGEGAPPKNEIIISRGEMVQIGGGFRIGEIIEATGATLRDVGATNKTTLDDYRRAISSSSAMVLKVHRSNFFMSGFVESPSASAIAALARKKRIPFVEDLGSGAVLPTEQFGLAEHEPTPSEALKAGADLVCFSGDKLFGGPQAGIIVGKKRFVTALKREPLFRALRCDKLCFAALQATIDLHLNQAAAEIPAIGLLQFAEDELRNRAAAISRRLSNLPLQITIGRSAAKVGGGTLPKSTMSSVTIEMAPRHCSPAQFATRLRSTTPPVIGYIANDRFKLDVRTIFPEQDGALVNAIRSACATSR
jgi:L-seryl-tRNA(Ser) seleniumtransferase